MAPAEARRGSVGPRRALAEEDGGGSGPRGLGRGLGLGVRPEGSRASCRGRGGTSGILQPAACLRMMRTVLVGTSEGLMSANTAELGAERGAEAPRTARGRRAGRARAAMGAGEKVKS